MARLLQSSNLLIFSFLPSPPPPSSFSALSSISIKLLRIVVSAPDHLRDIFEKLIDMLDGQIRSFSVMNLLCVWRYRIERKRNRIVFEYL